MDTVGLAWHVMVGAVTSVTRTVYVHVPLLSAASHAAHVMVVTVFAKKLLFEGPPPQIFPVTATLSVAVGERDHAYVP